MLVRRFGFSHRSRGFEPMVRYIANPLCWNDCFLFGMQHNFLGDSCKSASKALGTHCRAYIAIWVPTRYVGLRAPYSPLSFL